MTPVARKIWIEFLNHATTQRRLSQQELDAAQELVGMAFQAYHAGCTAEKYFERKPEQVKRVAEAFDLPIIALGQKRPGHIPSPQPERPRAPHSPAPTQIPPASRQKSPSNSHSVPSARSADPSTPSTALARRPEQSRPQKPLTATQSPAQPQLKSTPVSHVAAFEKSSSPPTEPSTALARRPAHSRPQKPPIDKQRPARPVQQGTSTPHDMPLGSSMRYEQSSELTIQGTSAASLRVPFGDTKYGSNVVPRRKPVPQPTAARSNCSSPLPSPALAKVSAAGSAAQAGLHLGNPTLPTRSIDRAPAPISSGWQGRKPPTYTKRPGGSSANRQRRDIPGNSPGLGSHNSNSFGQESRARTRGNASKPLGHIDLPPPPRPVRGESTLLGRLALVAYRTFRNVRQRR